MIPLNHDFIKETADSDSAAMTPKASVLDKKLFDMLMSLRKRVANSKNVPPFVVFQEPSIEEMATRYPMSIEEMKNIQGISEGKARRYGSEFISTIKSYVEEYDIIRPVDFTMKSVANKSKNKVLIIQSIDKKVPFEDIADTLNINMEALLHEMYMIVQSGTKLNINYYLDDNLDEEVIEEITDYFMEATSDNPEEAHNELGEEDYTLEEILLVRLKFLSDLAN